MKLTQVQIEITQSLLSRYTKIKIRFPYLFSWPQKISNIQFIFTARFQVRFCFLRLACYKLKFREDKYD